VGGDSGLLKRVEWYGWVLTGVLSAAVLVTGYPLVSRGCAIGGTLSVLHFKWLALFLTALVDPQKRRYRGITMIALGAYVVKYLIIAGIVYVLFRYQVVEPFGFLGGLSVIFLAICFAGIRRLRQLREPQG
jgi:ATP synthase I chain